MRIVEHWRLVLKHSWSLRLIVLSWVLSGIEFALPLFMNNPPIGRGRFAALAFVVSVAAGIARFVAQRALKAKYHGHKPKPRSRRH